MINKAVLLGHVGQDPEIRTTTDGREVATFSLATSERWRDKQSGERKERTEWHRCVVFNEGLVGVVKNYVKKGAKLYLEGKMQTRKWTDDTGTDRYTTEVVLTGFGATIVLLDKREGGPPPAGSEDDYGPAKTVDGGSFDKERDDEIPF